jgi:protein-disulfide isomerase
MAKEGKSAAVTTSEKKAIKSRREAERRRRQQQQTLLLSVGGVILLALVVIAILVSNRPADATLPDNVASVFSEIAAKPDYMTGRTADGYYFIGAENAPVTIEEFSSFSCSACLNYHASTFKNLFDKIRDGQLKFVYIPVTTTGEYVSDGQTRGALCAGEQGKFWEMSEVMFDWQTRYSINSNDYKLLTSAAGKLGLDTGKFSSCLSSDAVKQVIDKAAALMTQRTVDSTPTVYLDGKRIYPSLEGGGSGPDLSGIRGYIEDKVKQASSPK